MAMLTRATVTQIKCAIIMAIVRTGHAAQATTMHLMAVIANVEATILVCCGSLIW